MKKNTNIYALYKGDAFIDAGTYDELAVRQKMQRKYLRLSRSVDEEAHQRSR